MRDAGDVDRGEAAWGELLDGSHLVPPDRLPDLVAVAAQTLGGEELAVLVVDHAQDLLVPFPPLSREPDEGVAVEGTVPGRAFRLVEPQEVPAPDGSRRLWLPILDGIDRLGVLGVTVAEVDDLVLARFRRLAAVLAHLVHSKAAVGDSLVRTARRRPMELAAEIQWALMPPLTVGSERVVISAMLEPAYEVGGDSMDYALNEDVAHLAVFDAMGHGLQASLLASLAVGAYRNARRARRDLVATGLAIEAALLEQFGGERFVTALLCELELERGALRWVDAGHPAPLLVRAGRVVKTLEGRPDRPLGLGLNADLAVHEETLEPGDRVLAYTDGVIEARDDQGEQFGLDRLVDFLERATHSGEPIPESMRRLSKAVLAHQRGSLQDDATHVMLAWLPDTGSVVP